MTATKKRSTSAPTRPKTAPAGYSATSSRVRTVPAKPRRNRASAPKDFKTSTLNIRVTKDLKTQATETLATAGISVAEAVRVFLGRVVSEQSFPFPLHMPNAETAAALRDSLKRDRKRFSRAEDMFDDLEKSGGR